MIFDATGCHRCHQTGYCDRIGIFELLQVSDELRETIHHHPKHHTLTRIARKMGMTTLREDALRRLLLGMTTLEEVLRVTSIEGDNANDE